MINPSRRPSAAEQSARAAYARYRDDLTERWVARAHAGQLTPPAARRKPPSITEYVAANGRRRVRTVHEGGHLMVDVPAGPAAVAEPAGLGGAVSRALTAAFGPPLASPVTPSGWLLNSWGR